MKKALSIILSLCLSISMFGLGFNTQLIEAQAASMSLNYTSKTLTKGKTVKLKVKNTSKKAKWSSSNSKVASVNQNGTVTAKSIGTAKITAKIGNKSLSCKITVKKAAKKSSSTQKTSNKVYWTKTGKVYHSTSSCRTLSKSKNIQSGTNPPSGRRACKVCC